MSVRLPLLGARNAELETCGYCPKLCRAACPVSNAEPREALTPWGKMSLAWFTQRELIAADASTAATAWGCTGCGACTSRCDHQNPVTDTLYDARADARQRGLAPLASERVIRNESARDVEARAALDRLRRLPGVDADADTAVLVGCAYLRRAESVAEDAIVALTRLVGRVRLLDGCCGGALRAAGAPSQAADARRAVDARRASARRFIVVDPSCAAELDAARPELFVDVAHAALARLGPMQPSEIRLRWHDPCALGRGLGRYEQPRAILTRLLGAPPAEFPRGRSRASCSGGGGLLPLTMPEVSRAIASERIAQHDAEGGGVIVTHCAASLRRFRANGARAIDLATLVRRATD